MTVARESPSSVARVRDEGRRAPGPRRRRAPRGAPAHRAGDRAARRRAGRDRARERGRQTRAMPLLKWTGLIIANWHFTRYHLGAIVTVKPGAHAGRPSPTPTWRTTNAPVIEVESPHLPRGGGPARGVRDGAAGIAGCARRTDNGRRKRRAAFRGGPRCGESLAQAVQCRGVPAIRLLAGPVGHHGGRSTGGNERGGTAAGRLRDPRELPGSRWRLGGHEPQQLRRRHEVVAANMGS